jgi:hypothetical protein
MLPTGRERRRTDLYGRTRRVMYGILLAFAAPGAMAADGLGEIGKYAASMRDGLRVDMNTSAGAMHVKLNHSPEVRLDIDGGGGAMPVEAALKFNDAGGFSDDKVPQLTAKWRF